MCIFQYSYFFKAFIQSYDDESSEIRDDDPTDCLSDRQAALMDGGQFYVPDCTPDGRYKKVDIVTGR